MAIGIVSFDFVSWFETSTKSELLALPEFPAIVPMLAVHVWYVSYAVGDVGTVNGHVTGLPSGVEHVHALFPDADAVASDGRHATSCALDAAVAS